jgi:hypothetical protein
MIRSLIDSNFAWLIQSNIARFRQILHGELTQPQRQAIDRLLAEQQVQLDALERPDAGK